MTIPPKATITNVYNFLNTSSVSHKKYKNFFLLILVISGIIIISLPFINFSSNETTNFVKVNLENVNKLQEIKLKSSDQTGSPRNTKCTHWDCFNIYRCGHTGHDRITVYVYPLEKYVDENGKSATKSISKEYYNLIKGIVNSKYYTANPHEACLFVPFIDTLNEERIDLNLTSRVLNQLPL